MKKCLKSEGGKMTAAAGFYSGRQPSLSYVIGKKILSSH